MLHTLGYGVGIVANDVGTEGIREICGLNPALVSTNAQKFVTSWWLFQFIPYEKHIHESKMKEEKHFPVAIYNKAVYTVECQNKEYGFDFFCWSFLMKNRICLEAELLMRFAVFNPVV